MKKSMKIGLIAAAGLVIAACAGPSYKLVLKPYELQSKDFQFGSGLRILFQEDHTAPVVFVTNLVDHGSTSDPVGKEGIAHLIEHLCFRAKHHNGETVWDEIQGIGAGNFNAFTADDITQYYTEAPKEHLGTLLDIEAARMSNPVENVTDDVLKIEREVVRNELRFRVENTRAGNKEYEIIKEMLFPEGNVYHRTGIGTHDSLSAITMADIRKFTEDYYKPENMTIVVAGDFNAADAKELVLKHFPAAVLAGNHKPRTTPRIDPNVAAPEPPPPADTKWRYTKGPVSNPTVFLAWSMPGGHRANQELMSVTANILTYAVGSLLYPEDPRDKDKIEGVGCFLEPNKEDSIMMCEIELNEGQKPEEIAKKAIDGTWEAWDLDNDVFFRPALSRAKAGLLANAFRSSASLERAVSIADYLHFNNRADFFAESFNRISKINAFQTREIAHKYLTRDRVVVLITEPFGPKDTADTGSVALDKSATWAGSTQEIAAGSKTDFSKITAEQIASVVALPKQADFKELTLSNGLHVVLNRHGSAPFVQVALYTRGGSAQTKPWGFPDFDNQTSDTEPDPLQIAGSYFQRDFPDGSLMGVEGSAGNLPAALDMLEKRVSTRRSVWTRREFDLGLAKYKARLKAEEKRPDIWGPRALLKTLLPGHPLAESWDDETLKAVEKVSAGDFKEWLEKTYAPKNATLFVVGDINLDDAAKSATEIWSKWRAGDPGEPMPHLPPNPPPQSTRQIAIVDRSDATQSDITLACPLAPVTEQNRAAAAVIRDLLQKDLWAAVRERAGASYGIYAFPVHYAGGASYLEINSLVQNDKAKLAVQSMMDALRAIAGGKVKADTLNEAKWNAAQQAYLAYDSTDRMLSTLVSLTRDDRSLASINAYPNELAAVSAKDVQEMLAPCTGHEIIAIVGPDKSIHSPLASLGIPINMVDWKHGKPEVTATMSNPEPVPTTSPAPKPTPAPKSGSGKKKTSKR